MSSPVADAPIAPNYAARAEALRREGRPEEAERVARDGLSGHPGSAEGALALGLALLDQGREDEARLELQRGIAQAPLDDDPIPDELLPEASLAEISGPELDLAFEQAEADRDEIVDADNVAQEAIRRADSALDAIAASSESNFATQTVADLLETQGDSQRASNLRKTLRRDEEARSGLSLDPRQRTIETLERWVVNLRRPRS